jgi:hypothetical protein
MSFKKLEWRSATDLDSMGKAARQLLNRFVKKEEKRKAEGGSDEEDENEQYFDPQYCEAEKVHI